MLLKYLSALLFPLLISAGASYLLNLHPGLYSGHISWSLLFFVLLCALFNLAYYLMRHSAEFTGLLLAGITLRLLLSLVVLVICSLSYPVIFFAFAMHFITHYVLFTIFEIRYLTYLIRSKEKP